MKNNTVRRRNLIVLCLALIAALIVAAAPASAHNNPGKRKFRSLPPNLSTEYLEGHYRHRDRLHPNRKYRHRQLRTATDTTFEEFDGDVERVPAGAFCDFPIRIEQYGSVESWLWENKKGEVVHEVFNPNLKVKFRANGKSFWTIDEGWDYVWPNKDDSVFVEGTGTHFWVHDKHRKFRQYGTWHLVLSAEGELLYEKYFHDDTSIWDGTIEQGDAKVCKWLAKK